MVRKSWAIAGLLLQLGLTSGCGFRDRPGLLSRFRARGAAPDCNPYGMNGYEGSMVMPVSTPAGPCPCTTVPGGIIPAGGDIYLPNGQLPQIMPPPGNPPNQAAPAPADPSPGGTTGIRKATAMPTSKSGM